MAKHKIRRDCKGCKALNGSQCTLGYGIKGVRKQYNSYYAPTEVCPKPTTDKMFNKEKPR